MFNIAHFVMIQLDVNNVLMDIIWKIVNVRYAVQIVFNAKLILIFAYHVESIINWLMDNVFVELVIMKHKMSVYSVNIHAYSVKAIRYVKFVLR